MVRQVCDQVLVGTGGQFEPDDPQGNVVFPPDIREVIHRDTAAYMAISFREFRMRPFLFWLGPGEDSLHMHVQCFHPIQAAPKDAFGFCIRAADEEILSVFHDMGKIIIWRIAPVTNIDSRGAAGWTGACGVYHLAEGAVFIVLASRLDDDIGIAFIQDGVAGVDVSLIIAPRGWLAGFVKGVRIMGITENIQRGAVTGNELIFPMKKVGFQIPVKSQEQAP